MSSEILPRITGSELETSIMIQRGPRAKFVAPDDSYIINTIAHLGSPELSFIDDYGSNGSRVYKDIGSHLEYATPEDASFLGTLANEIAGERLVYNALKSTIGYQQSSDFLFHRRVIDERSNTWGYHVSLNADASKIQIAEDKLTLLGLHLATNNIYCGAGHIYRDPVSGQHKYGVAQKASQLDRDYSYASSSGLSPLISIRDEPLADSHVWRRVHLTSIDANMSPWATVMRIGTTSLVLRLMEDGYNGNDLTTNREMFKAAVQVAGDLSLRSTIELSDGRQVTAINMQEMILARAQRLVDNYDIPKEELIILTEWQRALDDLREDPQLLIDRTDWIARKVILEEYADRHHYQMSHRDMRRKDRQWDLISPSGIGMKLREGRWKRWMPSEELIQQRMVSAPRTRARIRASVIKRMSGPEAIKKEVVVGWDSVEIGGHKAYLSDPYQTYHPRINGLMG